MEKRVAADATRCPFLRPCGSPHLGAFPLGVYCRLPSGRVRIPSGDELARFCTTGYHRDCLAVRQARYLETVVSGLA